MLSPVCIQYGVLFALFEQNTTLIHLALSYVLERHHTDSLLRVYAQERCCYVANDYKAELKRLTSSQVKSSWARGGEVEITYGTLACCVFLSSLGYYDHHDGSQSRDRYTE